MKQVNKDRFQIGLPWKMKREGVSENHRRKNDIEEVENNFKGVYIRLVTTDKSVKKKGVQSSYNEVFVEYLERRISAK